MKTLETICRLAVLLWTGGNAIFTLMVTFSFM